MQDARSSQLLLDASAPADAGRMRSAERLIRLREIFANEDDEFPSVSPDGKLVAVTSEPERDSEIPVYVLRIADRRRIFQTRVSSTGHLITWTAGSAAHVAIVNSAKASAAKPIPAVVLIVVTYTEER